MWEKNRVLQDTELEYRQIMQDKNRQNSTCGVYSMTKTKMQLTICNSSLNIIRLGC